jgi:hypothetical protein
MLLDFILVGILGLFVGFGLLRGALVTGTKLAVLVLAYLTAVWAAQHLGIEMAQEMGWPEILGPPLAGSLGFILGYVIAGVASSLLTSWDRARVVLKGGSRGGLDRLLGGFFGGVRGAMVVLLLAWLAIWLDAGRDLGVLPLFGDHVPETSDSRVAFVTEKVVESAVESALSTDDGDGRSARVAARIAASPASALAGLRNLLDGERIAELQQDPLFWTLIENGATERATNRLSFYRIAQDGEMRQSLADLGIISPEAAKDVDVFSEEARTVLASVGPRLKGLRDDPELQQLAEDPKIVALLESGDTLALIQNPQIQGLVDRVSKGL